MIKAIILDVDGVIVGEKIGYNSPHPHKAVLEALKNLRQKGIAICLCTAKPHYAIPEIITDAQLTNPHITDAGAVIIDPIDNVIIQEHIIEKILVKKILQLLLDHNVYTEIYTVDAYFIQKDQTSDITTKHTHILQRKPNILASFVQEISKYDVTKIMPITRNGEDKKRVADILHPFHTNISLSWGVHPVALPLQFGIITRLGSSKKEGAESVIRSLDISFDEVLGIGDSISDWNFIQLCGYGATLANGNEELKKLLKSKAEGKFFVSSGSVDENGIVEILKYFF